MGFVEENHIPRVGVGQDVPSARPAVGSACVTFQGVDGRDHPRVSVPGLGACVKEVKVENIKRGPEISLHHLLPLECQARWRDNQHAIGLLALGQSEVDHPCLDRLAQAHVIGDQVCFDPPGEELVGE